MKNAEKEHIETLKWFEGFYSRNKKMVDIIVADNKKKMIKYIIPDFWAYIKGEYKKIEVYRIKGFTKFNWDELLNDGTTLEIVTLEGKPQLVYCSSNFHPGIRILNNKEYLTEASLKRLRETFKSLIINLEYYKKYNNMEVE